MTTKLTQKGETLLIPADDIIKVMTQLNNLETYISENEKLKHLSAIEVYQLALLNEIAGNLLSVRSTIVNLTHDLT